jgi:hypothetical protein
MSDKVPQRFEEESVPQFKSLEEMQAALTKAEEMLAKEKQERYEQHMARMERDPDYAIRCWRRASGDAEQAEHNDSLAAQKNVDESRLEELFYADKRREQEAEEATRLKALWQAEAAHDDRMSWKEKS